MLDDEKDLFIKEKLQQDKMISAKANDVFKNFKKEYLHIDDDHRHQCQQNDDASDSLNCKVKTEQPKDKKIQKEEQQKKNGKVVEFKPTTSIFTKMRNFTAVAASFVVAVSVGTGVAINVNKDSLGGHTQVESTINIDNGGTAGEYKVAEVKNEEVKVEEIKEKEITEVKISENELVKAVLMSDGNVAIQLKSGLLEYYKFRLDSSKMYKVSKINGEVEDIFVCRMIAKQNPYLLLLMKDKTVHVVQILSDGVVANNYKFDFYDQGAISGLKNVVSFEEKTEPLIASDNLFYYVNAITKDGKKKQIDDLESVSMSDLSSNKKTFTSQDGQHKYTVTADSDKCAQPVGMYGASDNLYYINDGCLYHMNLTNGIETKLVTGVQSIQIDKDSGYVIVKLKFANFIHAKGPYLKLEAYNVTESKVVSTKADENIILSLKEDGSTTIELKEGAIERLGAKDTFKEHYIYNFYAAGYCIQRNNAYSNYDSDRLVSNYYTDATAIYLGKVGTKDTICVAYATKNKELVLIDLTKYLKQSVGAKFEGDPGTRAFLISSGRYPKQITEMKGTTFKYKLKSGELINCKTIKVILEGNDVNGIVEETILKREGYTDVEFVSEEQ